MSRRKNEVTVSKSPFKRPDSPTYYSVEVYYRKPGATGKRSHTTICTGESDYKKAIGARDRIRDSFRCQLNAEELSDSDKQPLGECVQGYLSSNDSRWAPRWETQVRHFLESFASPKHVHPQTPVCRVTRELISKFCKSYNGATRWTAFKVLRAFVNYLYEEEKLPNPMPLKSLGREFKPKRPRRDYFHEEHGEFAAFYGKLPDDTYRQRLTKYACYFAQATGLRLGDVREFQECEIDFDLGVITREQGKPGTDVRVIISSQVEDAIRLQRLNKAQHKDPRVRNSEWLFCKDEQEPGEPYVTDVFSREFMKARRTILPTRTDLTFHGLRHTFGQNAYNHSVPMNQISSRLGHSNIVITSDHYATNDRSEEVSESYDSIRKYLNSRPVLSELSSSPEIITGQFTETELVECIAQQGLTTSKSD